MAIRRKTEVEKSQLPPKLSDLLLKGFTEQFMKDKFEAMFKETKGKVVTYLETNTDGFNADLGKGFKCDQGTVIYQSRSTYTYDIDKITDLVKSGKVSLDQVLACVSGFNAENLEKTLSTPTFNEVAEKKSTESLTFRGSSEFKAECEKEFVGPVASIKELEKELTVDVKKELSAAVPTAAEKAKAAKAKASSKKSAEDDIDAILGKK